MASRVLHQPKPVKWAVLKPVIKISLTSDLSCLLSSTIELLCSECEYSLKAENEEHDPTLFRFSQKNPNAL